MILVEGLKLGTKLEGEQLETANRLLRWHGIPEVGPCTVMGLINHMAPIEVGRLSHILGEISDALEGAEGGRDE